MNNDFDILSIATWRLSYMLTSEAGPYRIFEQLRAMCNPGGLFDCVFCTSIWVAAILLILWFSPFRPLVQVLAISGEALRKAHDSGIMYAGS
jgi:hypothetical protein